MAFKKAILGVLISVSVIIPLAASAQSINLSVQSRQQLLGLAQQLVQILNDMSVVRAYGQAYLSSTAFIQQGTVWAAQILQIQQQIASILSSATMYSTGSGYGGSAYSGSYCPSLSRALEPGMQGNDVAQLQQFLQKVSAAGYVGSMSGVFDTQTLQAVQRLQAAYGVVSSGDYSTSGFGRVGPGTRMLISSICSSLGAPTNTNYPPPTNTSTTGYSLTLEAEEDDASYSVFLTATFKPGPNCATASYELDWGDDEDRTLSFDGSCSTQTRTLTHRYDASGNYSIQARDTTTNNVVTVNFNASAIEAAGAGQNNTILHIKGDGSITDNSSTGKSVYASGNASVSGTSRVGSGSIFFDGSGDYVSIESSSDFNYGSGAFTVSFWFRPEAFPASGDQAALLIQSGSNAANSSLGGAGLELYGNRLYFVGRIGGTTYHPSYDNSINSSALSTGTWYHVAVVRSGNTVKLYLNGVSQGSIGVSGSANASSGDLAIGRYGDYDGNYFNGFIDDVQITKGFARWNGNFDPPGGTAADASTNLLLHADGADGSTVFTDASPAANSVTAYGNVQIDTAQSKFGGGSILFDGSSGSLSIPDNAGFDFGTSNFTIDMWVRPTSLANSYSVLGKGTGNGSFLIYQSSNRSSPASTWLFYATGADGSWSVCSAVSMGSVVLNAWTHLAVVRSGNTITTYKDGVAQGTCTSALGLLDNSSPIIVGEYSGVVFPGHIDELRISKGTARWTSNFTPPTASGQ